MTAPEDNFEIDIYGDGDEYQGEEQQMDETIEQGDQMQDTTLTNDTTQHHEQQTQAPAEHSKHKSEEPSQSAASSLKRKDGANELPLDAGATAALMVSELHWWINDDDIRGWANQSSCEDALQEITFSEHKVNGKSKGQVYLLFGSPQAATAVKHKIESFGEGQKYRQKFTVNFSNPSINPYKTLPKDGNARAGQQNRTPSAPVTNNSFNSNNTNQAGFSGGFRGGRGGYNNNRGGGYNRGGFQQQNTGGFQGGGYQAQPMGMQSFNNFGGRGGMMGGMRGGMSMRGRGGMNQNMMGGWGNMNAMPNMMGMPNMGAMNMPAFQSPGFFPQQGAMGDASWNPHGGKRQRQE